MIALVSILSDRPVLGLAALRRGRVSESYPETMQKLAISDARNSFRTKAKRGAGGGRANPNTEKKPSRNQTNPPRRMNLEKNSKILA